MAARARAGRASASPVASRCARWRSASPPKPFPVEYKRGKPKSHRADEVQLCAQGICLEEAFGTTIPEGAPFYGVTRRRPPLDRMNALLSFLYALLGHDCRSALEAHGLDPQVGFLHADRPGRASLVLDLMEELRPVLADRLALSMVNRRQLAAADFVVEEAGGVRLTDDARKRVLVAWQERKREEIRHPFLDETLPFSLVAHAQAQMLARHLRGDLDGYPAFVWK